MATVGGVAEYTVLNNTIINCNEGGFVFTPSPGSICGGVLGGRGELCQHGVKTTPCYVHRAAKLNAPINDKNYYHGAVVFGMLYPGPSRNCCWCCTEPPLSGWTFLQAWRVAARRSLSGESRLTSIGKSYTRAKEFNNTTNARLA